FSEDKPVAGRIKGAAGPRGRIVVGGKRPEQAERGKTDWVEHGIEAAGQHEIDLAAPHHLEGRADGLATRGASRVDGRRVTADTKITGQQGQPGVGLAAAETHRVRRKLAVEQPVGMKLAII